VDPGLWPRELVSSRTFVPELLASLFARELPVDLYVLAIVFVVPDRCLLLQQGDGWDSSLPRHCLARRLISISA
jgi:hypothetical protein